MSSKFLTFIFIILVSVQLSSCGWGFPWKIDGKEESSTRSTSEKSFKDDEPNSSSAAPIEDDASKLPLPKDLNVLSIDDNTDESSRESTAQSKKTTLENVSAMPNKELDEYPEEESSNFANSENEIKSIPPTSTDFTDKIVNYVSSVSAQITDSSTPTTEKSESESYSTTNTTTPSTTENTLNDNDDVNNVPRNADEDRENSKDTSSVVSSSTISSSLENSSFENEVVSNSSENIFPEVTYAPKDKDVSSSTDEDEEPTSDDQSIGRKETHSSRDVTDKPGSSTPKITETSEIVSTSVAMTDTPTTTENLDNSTSIVNVPRNVNGTASHDPSDLDPSASMQANTTIETILSTSTATMNTTEMAGSMSNGTTPEVNFGSFVNSGSTSNAFSPLILNLCILIFSVSVIV